MRRIAVRGRTLALLLGLATASAAGLFSIAVTPTALASTATYTATETIPVPPASSYAGSGGGDGWAVAMSSTEVFNVFHHSSQLEVACHYQSDASPCWSPETITDNNGSEFAVSGQPGLWFDQSSGDLYVYATRTSDDTGGVVCIDTNQAPTNPDPFCGFTALTAVGDAPLGSGISAISDPAMVGSRWYAFNYVDNVGVTGTANTLMCFDTATLGPCSGQPYTVPVDSGAVSDPDYPPPAVAAIGSRVIVPITVGGTDELACFDATSGRGCTGSWPVQNNGFTYSSNYGAPYPLLSPNGTITGLCLPTGQDPCYDLTGASVPTPAGMPQAIGATSGWNGPAFVVGPRVYVPNGNLDQVDCYDASADASCQGYPYTPSNLGLLYTVNADPQRPSCIWINSDNGGGQIQNFDAYSEGGCGQGPIRVLTSALVAPSSQCVPYSYHSLQITSPPPSAYSDGTVQFEDPDGNPIPGTSTTPLDGTGAVNLAGMSLNTAIGLPEFLITLNGASGAPGSVTVQVQWTGDYDPACDTSSLTVQPPNNPILNPVVQQPNNPTLNPVVVVAPGGGSGVAGGPVPAPSGSSLLSKKWKVAEVTTYGLVVGVGYVGCGGLIVATPDTAGLSSALAEVECGFSADSTVSLINAIDDPPDSHYRRVFAPPPIVPPALHFACRRLAPNDCRKAQAIALRYERATARVTALSEAVAVTVDRYGSALRAGDQAAADAQKRAAARYLPEQKRAVSALKAAGRSLAHWLEAHGVKRKLSAKQIAHARVLAIELRGVPPATIRNLKRLGLITGRKQLSHTIASAFRKAASPRSTTLVKLLGG